MENGRSTLATLYSILCNSIRNVFGTTQYNSTHISGIYGDFVSHHWTPHTHTHTHTHTHPYIYIYIHTHTYIPSALGGNTAGTSVVPNLTFDTGRAANIPLQSIPTKLSVGQLAEFIICLFCTRYVQSLAAWKAVISITMWQIRRETRQGSRKHVKPLGIVF